MLSLVKLGDTIIFDSVSRMSRNADERIQLYLKLFDKDVNLVFLKEDYINTEVLQNLPPTDYRYYRQSNNSHLY